MDALEPQGRRGRSVTKGSRPNGDTKSRYSGGVYQAGEIADTNRIALRLMGERREGGQGKREPPPVTLPKLKFMEKELPSG